MMSVSNILKARRGQTPYEDFARELDMKTATVYRIIKEERSIGIIAIRKIAAWAVARNDRELISALTFRALGYTLEELN